jgi:hypothetical protein
MRRRTRRQSRGLGVRLQPAGELGRQAALLASRMDMGPVSLKADETRYPRRIPTAHH